MSTGPLTGFAPLSDHGLEVIRKAGEPVEDPIISQQVEYQVRVRTMPGSVTSFEPATVAREIINFPVLLADTEYEIPMPANCRGVTLRARKVSRLKIAYAAGETDTNYFSVGVGGYFEDLVSFPQGSIFFKCDLADNVIEVLTFV